MLIVIIYIKAMAVSMFFVNTIKLNKYGSWKKIDIIPGMLPLLS